MLKIEKVDFYYRAKGDDALALMAITGLEIRRDGTCVFNEEYIDKIEWVLAAYSIPYSVLKDGELAISKSGKDENYFWFVKLGKSIQALQDYINADVRRIKKALRNINQL